MTKFTKLYIALKGRLLGLGYYKALIALEKAKEIHNGLRKDGETPEFQHMLEIALHITSLKGIVRLEDTIICALLHDTLEDYPELVSEQWILETFGAGTFRIDERCTGAEFIVNRAAEFHQIVAGST